MGKRMHRGRQDIPYKEGPPPRAKEYTVAVKEKELTKSRYEKQGFLTNLEKRLLKHSSLYVKKLFAAY